MPTMRLRVRGSLNTTTPKNIAVKGSSAPNIAVVVEPINLIAILIVSIEIIVGKIARASAQAKILQSFIGCNSVQNFKLKINTNNFSEFFFIKYDRN